jgi:uncharacterized protein YbjT (DUF2867 family)
VRKNLIFFGTRVLGVTRAERDHRDWHRLLHEGDTMILVTGATGTVGRQLVEILARAGEPVRALTRDPAKAKFDAKVEVSTGDLEKPDTLAKALAGVERVFSLGAAGPGLATQEGNLAQAAKKAGAKHVVKLSVLGAGTGSDNPVIGWHEAGENAIKDSGLAWTFVRPGMFMSNALAWLPSIKSQGKVFLPYGNGKVAPIHPRDIAAVAAKALTGEGHEGKAYGLSGPDALSTATMVETLSKELKKPIQYVPVGPDTAKENLLKAGMPAVLVDALLKFSATLRAGQDQTPLPTVTEVLGRPALTWSEWVRENAAAFA